MRHETDILIVGGGLAGLTSAIHLSTAGFQVILIEKNPYPQHKVCGEYISNEVLPYLQWLDADPSSLLPTSITKLQVSTISGNTVNTNLPLGGFGLSRYRLDYFLYTKALERGCTIVHDTVTGIDFQNEQFKVTTPQDTFTARIVLGAHGKRALLDHKLKRDFIAQKSPWLAIKAHYKGVFPNDLVALHNFKGGYCGVSKVENDLMNICYLVDYASFKQYKNISTHQQQVLYKNRHLQQIFENSSLEFEAPITISQISFKQKEAVKDHVLMIGDSAGLIHPLCGNGMGMAIHSAKISSELIIDYFKRTAGSGSRLKLETDYKRSWHDNFNKRLVMGHLLSGILRREYLAELLLNGLVKFPSLLPMMIKQTHGKPLIAASSCL